MRTVIGLPSVLSHSSKIGYLEEVNGLSYTFDNLNYGDTPGLHPLSETR